MTHVPKTLPVGHTCRWYQYGDTNNAPKAAIVTRTDGTGMLGLTLIQHNYHNLVPLNGVRHKDDPRLKNAPHLRQEQGCWDFLEALCWLPKSERQSPSLPADVDAPSPPPGPEFSEQTVEVVMRLAETHGKDMKAWAPIARGLKEETGLGLANGKIGKLLKQQRLKAETVAS